MSNLGRMNIMKKLILLSTVFTLAACGPANAQETTTSTTSNQTVVSDTQYFTDRDLNASYDEASATKISLSGSSANIEGTGASFSGNVVTIAAEGTYLISGESEGIQIKVEANDTAKVQIVLKDVTMVNEEAPIYIQSADKVFLTLAEGTTNQLSDGTSRTDETIDAVIFSRSDLTINGTGKLEITGSFNNGIESKDDLKIVDAEVTINASNNGIRANDALNIQGAILNLTTGNDGIKAENDDDLTLGMVYLNPKSVTINAIGDGIQASNTVEIAGGEIEIQNSNEGIEAMVIHQTGGNVSVISIDDGLNTSDPTSTESSGPGMGANANLSIVIDGGVLKVNAEGDGLDSNGSLEINGGEVYVQGSQMGGNGAIDADSQPIINGGTVIAIGTADMAQGFVSGSSQASIAANVNGSAGSIINIKDESGNVVASLTADKAFQSVIASVEGMTEGATYSVEVDGFETSVQASSSTGSGMMGGPSGFPGGQQPPAGFGNR